MPYKCFMVEPTGKMSEMLNGVSCEIWRRLDTGEDYSGKDPVGAMYYCREDSQKYYKPGPDGRTLFVVTPYGVWNIDSRASNCTLPDDDVHFCWIRHGVPPNITVNKAGVTCAAGAGSIAQGKEGEPDYYHGFLQNGELT